LPAKVEMKRLLLNIEILSYHQKINDKGTGKNRFENVTGKIKS
jgi:hypothetical protein